MAAKDKTTLASDIATQLADGSNITAGELRGVLGDLLDSITQNGKATGAGTDYALTGTSALADFGTTDPSVSLPGAGSFLIQATVQLQADASGAGDEVRLKLRNTTDGTDIGIERRVTMPANDALAPVDLTEIVTVAAAKTVQLWAFNATSARGTVLSAGTALNWVRLA